MKTVQRWLWVAGFVLSAVFAALAATRYVSLSGGDQSPYTNWTDAALTIQSAVDVAVAGDVIVVSNGVYNIGGVAVTAAMTNRVAITTAVCVVSANGPEVTIIEGQGPMGSDAVRGVYLAAGAELSGFTVRGGFTHSTGDNYYAERAGAGIWCEGGALVSNCWVIGNNAATLGGGGYDGTLVDSRVVSNTAPNGGGWFDLFARRVEFCRNGALYGGGAYGGYGFSCQFLENWSQDSCGGGAVYSGEFEGCLFKGNTAQWDGGAADNSRLINCLLFDNEAARIGGGANRSRLVNCTVVGNQAYYGGGVGAIAADGASATNCIIYYNSASVSNNYYSGLYVSCCADPAPSGAGCFRATPWFVDYMREDFHLQRRSACIDAGTNIYLVSDYDGTLRPLDGNTNGVAIIDVGCCEFDPATADSDGDGLADRQEMTNYLCDPLVADSDSDGIPDGEEVISWHTDPNETDSDDDGVTDHDEVISGTDPTNAASLFGLSGMLALSSNRVAVQWAGSTGAQYAIESCSNLVEGSWQAETNPAVVAGAAGVMTWTSGVQDVSRLYRAGFRSRTRRVLMQTSMGNITFELYPDLAPGTVSNFMQYVADSHFDGTIFHRVVAGSFYIIQGGHFDTNLVGRTTRATIPNEAWNGLLNNRGAIAMARTSDPNSATDQFFINVQSNGWNYRSEPDPYWGYCVFGTVIAGQTVVDAINAVPTESRSGFDDIPVEDVVVLSVVEL